MRDAKPIVHPKSVLATRGMLRELFETLAPEALTVLSDEIEEKLAQTSTRTCRS